MSGIVESFYEKIVLFNGEVVTRINENEKPKEKKKKKKDKDKERIKQSRANLENDISRENDEWQEIERKQKERKK